MQAYNFWDGLRYHENSSLLVKDKQQESLETLNSVLKLDGEDCGIYEHQSEESFFEVRIKDSSKPILVYPAMYSEANIPRSDNVIIIPDRLLKVALPKAWQLVKNKMLLFKLLRYPILL